MSKVSGGMQVPTEMDAGKDQQADYSSQACGLLATAAFAFGLQVSLVLFHCVLSTAACRSSNFAWQAFGMHRNCSCQYCNE